MTYRILVFYGSYRSDRMGIRLAQFVVDGLRGRGDEVELIDAKAVGLPMLDRMYKEYPKGAAPAALEKLAGQIRDADGFVFITGEYNWGIQPGLKNLTDHFLEEWFWRPAAIASYSAGRFAGARAATAWHGTRSRQGLFRKRCPRTASRSAREERRWSERFHVSPMISFGGSRLRRCSGREKRRPIEAYACSVSGNGTPGR
jgi:NAD(P)H-dependent FMN reductase